MTKSIKVADVIAYLNMRLNKELGTKDNFFNVTLEYVPHFNKWYVFTNMGAMVNYEVQDLSSFRDFEVSEKVLKELIAKIREFFSDKGIKE